MDSRLKKLVEETVKAAAMNDSEKNALQKELDSHFMEQVHDLTLSGLNLDQAISKILSEYGDPELIGEGITMAHRNPSFLFISQYISLIKILMKKHPQRILSVIIFLILAAGNLQFLHHWSDWYERSEIDSVAVNEILSDYIENTPHTVDDIKPLTDLDKNGKITDYENAVFSYETHTENLAINSLHIAPNVLSLTAYLLVMLDAIGLGVVLYPWLKRS